MKTQVEPISKQLNFIKSFVNQSVTADNEWVKYDALATDLGKAFREKIYSDDEKTQLREAFGTAMTTETLQGFVYLKPHGYAGDYEIIDKIYTYHESPNKQLAKWDKYLHSFPAVKAVRNRKTYIKGILNTKVQNNEKTFEMLNLASGPARDLHEFFTEQPNANLAVDCIELDQDAINYAQNLLGQHASKVSFIQKNILRYSSDKKYDLVWSAGLFDYFNDDIFKRLLGRFITNVAVGGELIIGNFCASNPNIAYMELLDWILYHRTAEDLIRLANECGIESSRITVEKEPEGVNLFMRIRC